MRHTSRQGVIKESRTTWVRNSQGVGIGSIGCINIFFPRERRVAAAWREVIGHLEDVFDLSRGYSDIKGRELETHQSVRVRLGERLLGNTRRDGMPTLAVENVLSFCVKQQRTTCSSANISSLSILSALSIRYVVGLHAFPSSRPLLSGRGLLRWV